MGSHEGGSKEGTGNPEELYPPHAGSTLQGPECHFLSYSVSLASG